MKKRLILAAMAAIMTMTAAIAQQIAVVSEGGETSVYQTFQAAIEGASPNSVIYLPGGGFPLPDSVKITKKLTFIGIGHRSDNDNVDGITTISGNLWFNEGSSGSAVMGCYITGDVNIGDGDASVNNVLIKCCNLNSVQVRNNTCSNTQVNQNYIRSHSFFRGGSGKLSNNIMFTLQGLNGGSILNNIVTGYRRVGDYNEYAVEADNSLISYNIVFFKVWHSGWTGNVAGANIRGSNNQGTSNIVYGASSDWGDNPINLTDSDWNDVFVNYNGGAINPMTDFHFTEAYQQYSYVGIYGGSGFNDHQTAPVPYIVAKRIAEETDAAGQLKIQVRVKAGD